MVSSADGSLQMIKLSCIIPGNRAETGNGRGTDACFKFPGPGEKSLFIEEFLCQAILYYPVNGLAYFWIFFLKLRILIIDHTIDLMI